MKSFCLILFLFIFYPLQSLATGSIGGAIERETARNRNWAEQNKADNQRLQDRIDNDQTIKDKHVEHLPKYNNTHAQHLGTAAQRNLNCSGVGGNTPAKRTRKASMMQKIFGGVSLGGGIGMVTTHCPPHPNPAHSMWRCIVGGNNILGGSKQIMQSENTRDVADSLGGKSGSGIGDRCPPQKEICEQREYRSSLCMRGLCDADWSDWAMPEAPLCCDTEYSLGTDCTDEAKARICSVNPDLPGCELCENNPSIEDCDVCEKEPPPSPLPEKCANREPPSGTPSCEHDTEKYLEGKPDCSKPANKNKAQCKCYCDLYPDDLECIGDLECKHVLDLDPNSPDYERLCGIFDKCMEDPSSPECIVDVCEGNCKISTDSTGNPVITVPGYTPFRFGSGDNPIDVISDGLGLSAAEKARFKNDVARFNSQAQNRAGRALKSLGLGSGSSGTGGSSSSSGSSSDLSDGDGSEFGGSPELSSGSGSSSRRGRSKSKASGNRYLQALNKKAKGGLPENFRTKRLGKDQIGSAHENIFQMISKSYKGRSVDPAPSRKK